MPSNLLSPARNAYQQSAVMTASQGQLIVMLYDGAHRFLAQAATAMADGQTELAHNKLRRAEMIISHLRSSLVYDSPAGDLAVRLEAIYDFCSRHLNKARMSRDPQPIQEVDELLLRLRSAWAQVADAPSAAA